MKEIALRMRPTLLATCLVVVLAGCGGAANPTATFNGAECSYSGPASVDAGETEVTYHNASGIASAFAFLKLVDESGRADAVALIGTRRSVAGAPPPPSMELVGLLQAAPGEEVTQTAPLTSGTYFLDCVTFSGDAPDEVWRVAVLEVEE